MVDIPASSFFDIGSRLFSLYYPEIRAGLSSLAFRTYVLKCRSVRRNRKATRKCPKPTIVWSGRNDVERNGSHGLIDPVEYENALEELYEKCFLIRRPDLEDPKHPEMHEILLQPDYVNGDYRPVFDPMDRETMKKNGDGFIMVPNVFVSKKQKSEVSSRQHKFWKKYPDPVIWSVMIKLYEINYLPEHGGCNPAMLRRDSGKLIIDPWMWESLKINEDDFLEALSVVEDHGIICYAPVQLRYAQAGGYYQWIYDGEGDRFSDTQTSVARLKYQPRNQFDKWEQRLSQGFYSAPRRLSHGCSI